MKVVTFGCIVLIGVSIAQDVSTLPTISSGSTVPFTSTVSTTTPGIEGTNDAACLPTCRWKHDTLKTSTMKNFPTLCDTVCTDSSLNIGSDCDMSESQLNETLRNMKHLVGGLSITDTKFKSARFLANLETVDCGVFVSGVFAKQLWLISIMGNANMEEIGMVNLKSVFCKVSIYMNENLTRLNMPNLVPTNLPYATNQTLQMMIVEHSVEFCISVQEVSSLITNDYVELWNIIGKFCPISASTGLSEKRTCDLQNQLWSNTSLGCVNVLGDVVIDDENEQYARQLESVENIFGSLIINGTSLKNIDFLGKLRAIVSLTDNQPGLIVARNSLLTNVSTPSLKRINARSFTTVKFDDNGMEMIKNPGFCYYMRNITKYMHQNIVQFDGKYCEEVEKDATKSSKMVYPGWILIGFLVILKF